MKGALMVVGTVTIQTLAGEVDVRVEILDVIQIRDKKMAYVRALKGEPFTKFTHGGPAQYSTTYVFVETLKNKEVISAQEPN
jgi:hypothetical protein